jgi:dTDP-4-dehydrorhamnose 3,5-epimerase
MDDLNDIIKTNIDGLFITKLKSFNDQRGAVLKFIDKTKDQFVDFGEVYFSVINEGVTKGWKLHKLATQNICAVYGETTFVILDRRDNSQTFNQTQEITINPIENHLLITIPPGLWYAFRSNSIEFSIISNVSSIIHDTEESESLDFNNDIFNNEWKK